MGFETLTPMCNSTEGIRFTRRACKHDGGISDMSHLRLGKDSDMIRQNRFIRLSEYKMDKVDGKFRTLH